MRVLLVANYLNDEQQSMQRFAALMERALRETGHEVCVRRPPGIVGNLHPRGHGLGKWLGYIDKFGVFPITLRAAVRWCDVVHICDHANSFYVKYLRSRPHLVTCHDVLALRSALGEVPENRTAGTGRQLQRMILNGLRQAQHIVCVSEATRAELLRIASIPKDRVSRAYNALNYPYSRMAEPEASAHLHRLGIDPSQPFLLHVGGNQWYKNRLGALQIFSFLRKHPAGQNLKLVMAGKPWTDEMRKLVSECGLLDATCELTSVTNESLRALYSSAKMLLFPSLEEGFGWPILEAQACGCPVVTSSRSPMDEVGGSAAVYVDPENPESAAATIASVVDQANSLREASFQNAARFDESMMIRSYLTIYEKVYNEHTARHQLS
jgi:glycosyltransferase involved in cell wall biosynthesis